jgi:two-component system LytT family response regulator
MSLLPDDGPQIVLCTAHAEYAVKAFDEGATDYLLKPVEPLRLRKALDRVRARRGLLQMRANPRNRELVRLALPTKQGIVLLDPRAVSHAVLDGVLVTVFSTQGAYVTDFSLQELERKLPDTFLRVHRRALVNLERVVRLEPVDTGGYLARTDQGQTVEVSRQAARDLRKWLGLRRAPDGEPE